MTKTRHDGDCTIYASLCNENMLEAGICTCGYGREQVQRCKYGEMYSKELQERLRCIKGSKSMDTKSDMTKILDETIPSRDRPVDEDKSDDDWQSEKVLTYIQELFDRAGKDELVVARDGVDLLLKAQGKVFKISVSKVL